MLLITLDQLKEEYRENYQRILSPNDKELLVIAPLKEIWKTKDKEKPKQKDETKK